MSWLRRGIIRGTTDRHQRGMAVKGPAGRFKYDLHRHWQCPVCNARRWTGGHVVNLHCPRCAGHNPPRETWMQLVETARKAPPRKNGTPPEAQPPEAQPPE